MRILHLLCIWNYRIINSNNNYTFNSHSNPYTQFEFIATFFHVFCNWMTNTEANIALEVNHTIFSVHNLAFSYQTKLIWCLSYMIYLLQCNDLLQTHINTAQLYMWFRHFFLSNSSVTNRYFSLLGLWTSIPEKKELNLLGNPITDYWLNEINCINQTNRQINQ